MSQIEINEVKTSVAQILERFQRLEDSLAWVTCPFCGDEWSKLKECEFYQAGEKSLSSVCVECGETVKGLPFLANFYPLPGAKVDIASKPFPGGYDRPRAAVATVTYGSVAFSVRNASDQWLEVVGGSGEKKLYPNSYQAWFAIRGKIIAGETSIPSKVLPARRQLGLV